MDTPRVGNKYEWTLDDREVVEIIAIAESPAVKKEYGRMVVFRSNADGADLLMKHDEFVNMYKRIDPAPIDTSSLDLRLTDERIAELIQDMSRASIRIESHKELIEKYEKEIAEAEYILKHGKRQRWARMLKERRSGCESIEITYDRQAWDVLDSEDYRIGPIIEWPPAGMSDADFGFGSE